MMHLYDGYGSEHHDSDTHKSKLPQLHTFIELYTHKYMHT